MYLEGLDHLLLFTSKTRSSNGPFLLYCVKVKRKFMKCWYSANVNRTPAFATFVKMQAVLKQMVQNLSLAIYAFAL